LDPKLRVRPAPGMHMGMGMPGMPQGPITIVSKIPHVVCRVASGLPDTLFALREQDTSVPEPLSSFRRDRMPYYGFAGMPPAVQYLAIDYRPGEMDKKLTFIVQKTRKPEFFVKVPKGERDVQN
jgi:hypothetical protein